MAVVTASRSTCPKTCPFRNNGCYANEYPLRWHWDALSKGLRGGSFHDLMMGLRMLPRGEVVRYGDAGDFPGNGRRLDGPLVMRLAALCHTQGLRMYGYTQYLKVGASDRRYNVRIIRRAAEKGLVINVSDSGMTWVDAHMRRSLPVAVVLPSDTTGKVLETPGGRRVVICPAIRGETNCKYCGGRRGPLCLRWDRKVAIGFPAHGPRKGRIDRMLS